MDHPDPAGEDGNGIGDLRGGAGRERLRGTLQGDLPHVPWRLRHRRREGERHRPTRARRFLESGQRGAVVLEGGDALDRAALPPRPARPPANPHRRTRGGRVARGELGRGAHPDRREDAGDEGALRRRGGGFRARHGRQQHPHRLASRQPVRHAQRHLHRLFLLRAQGRGVQGDGCRQVHRQVVGHRRGAGFLLRPQMYRRMGLAKAHQQRPRADRPQADDQRAQEGARQHRGRPAQAGLGGARRHLAAAPARHRRGDGAGVDAGDGRRGALRRGVRRKVLPRLRGAVRAVEGVSAREGGRDHLVRRRRDREGRADLRHDEARLHRLGQRHRPARQQHLPGDALAADPDGAER